MTFTKGNRWPCIRLYADDVTANMSVTLDDVMCVKKYDFNKGWIFTVINWCMKSSWQHSVQSLYKHNSWYLQSRHRRDARSILTLGHVTSLPVWTQVQTCLCPALRKKWTLHLFLSTTGPAASHSNTTGFTGAGGRSLQGHWTLDETRTNQNLDT